MTIVGCELNQHELLTRHIPTLAGPAERHVRVDYFKAGMLYDPVEGRMRTVYGFIATLSFSRHKFVEFVFRQDQQSFVSSWQGVEFTR